MIVTEGSQAPPDRRAQILAAAEAVFAEHGFTAATVDAVAEKAGVAKGSVYNYFANKRDLFYQVFARAIAGITAETEALVTTDMPAAAKLEAILDLWTARMVEMEHVGRLVLEFWATAARQERQSDLAQTFQQMYAASRRQLTAVLEAGAASGEFKGDLDAPVAAGLIMAALDGIMLQSILDMGVHLDEPFIAALKRTVLAAVRATNGPRSMSTDAGPSRDDEKGSST